MLTVSRGLVILIVLFGSAHAVYAQPTIDEIRGAWRQRQESAESLRIAWTVERTIVAGSMTNYVRFFNRPEAPNAPTEPPADFPPVPAEDTTLTSECELSVSGDRARYHVSGEIWSSAGAELPRPLVRESTIVYDGARCIEFTPAGVIDDAPQAVIRPGRQNLTVYVNGGRPIVWCYRPLDIQRGGLHEEWLKLTGETLIIDGREHWGVIEEFSPRSGMTFWVDPERDFFVSRVTTNQYSTSGRELLVNIEYQPAGENGWALAGWTLQHLDDGELLSHYAGRVRSIRVNDELPDELLTVEFPPGTRVSEYALGATRPVTSIVGESGR